MSDPRRGRLRELLARPGLIVAPGAYDALSARLIEQAGFEVDAGGQRTYIVRDVGGGRSERRAQCS